MVATLSEANSFGGEHLGSVDDVAVDVHEVVEALDSVEALRCLDSQSVMECLRRICDLSLLASRAKSLATINQMVFIESQIFLDLHF